MWELDAQKTGDHWPDTWRDHTEMVQDAPSPPRARLGRLPHLPPKGNEFHRQDEEESIQEDATAVRQAVAKDGPRGADLPVRRKRSSVKALGPES